MTSERTERRRRAARVLRTYVCNCGHFKAPRGLVKPGKDSPQCKRCGGLIREKNPHEYQCDLDCGERLQVWASTDAVNLRIIAGNRAYEVYLAGKQARGFVRHLALVLKKDPCRGQGGRRGVR